jgi:hypothetical protein
LNDKVVGFEPVRLLFKKWGFARLHAAAVTWEIDTHAINRVMPQSIDDAGQSPAIFSQSTDRYLEQGRNIIPKSASFMYYCVYF